MDHFMEEVVVKHNRGVENTLYILSNIIMVLSALWALMCIQMLFMQFSIYGLIEALVTAGVAVLLFLRRDRLRTEYEYTFTNGDLDFAQVFNNQKRKTLGTMRVKNVEAFGPVDSNAFRKLINQYVLTHCGDSAPVSSLEIDAALTRPSLITLQEVEELSRLEPYGAGNNRPVFCLRGARLESMQSVGQNKHLKLRLQKGHTSFDGIFFSVTPAECGLTVGERVDAAFYLQVNEFRGSRSLQLQLVDLRSAHDPGAREAEQLELCRTLIRGGGVSAKDAAKLLPSREQFVRVWRALEREVDGTLTSPELPFLRRLSAEALGAESFPRTVMCLAVFAERGLVTVERHDKYITLRLTGGKRVDLDASPYLCALREGLDGTKGGSSA